MTDDKRPVGIFDSGVGGLTVLQAVAERLPNENIIYFGDTAHLPYGNKSPEAIIKYSLAAYKLLKEMDIKIMVVACNTASVYAIEALKETGDIPVVGVVESGVEAAISIAVESVGIIGTYGTVNSRSYEDKIKQKNADLKIFSRACPLFVPLVEEGWLQHPVTQNVAEIYLSEFRNKIDSLILACTHYPLLKEIIADTLGEEVRIIDSATEVAMTVEKKMTEMDIINRTEDVRSMNFFVSDGPLNFIRTGKIFLGYPIENVAVI
ncbi:MAG: glutamate racemase [Elusimicrobiota bacterium]